MKRGSSFNQDFEQLFEAEYPRLFRYLDRLSGDSDLAADLAQEAFIRLHRRGVMPERPSLWLVTVGLNLFRNARSTTRRRARLLSLWRPHDSSNQSTPPEVSDEASRVRTVMTRLPERERELLLLRAEGYSYREMASALGLNPSSVGTLLARAREAFRRLYGERDASH